MSSPLHNRKIKTIVLDIGGTTFQCQIENFQVLNNTPDGDKLYSMCDGGADVEETDEDWALSLRWFADWRSNGLSDFLMLNDGLNAAVTLEHHPDIPGEHTIWTGTIRIKAPNVGGDVKTTERQEQTFQFLEKPDYDRP
jgi:hypothetical protein